MSPPKVYLFATTLLLTALACRAAMPPTEVPTVGLTPVQAYLLDLPAEQGWVSTGQHLSAGQRFEIAYLSGQARDGNLALADASGSAYVCTQAGCCEPLPGVPRDALIGRLGRKVFYIGNGGTFTAPASGTLELRLNDCDAGLYDNQGSLRLILIP